MRTLLLLAFLIAAPPATAQLVPLAEGGARALALGRAATALDGDAWGLYNPASWATLTEGAAGLYASQAFGLAELRLGAVTVAQPTALGVVSASARSYGFEDFRESVFGVGVGRALPLSATRWLHAGLALRYTHVAIPDFGSGGAVGLSGGILTEVVPGLTFGAHALNVNRPALSEADPLETRLDVGLAYRAHPDALVLVSASKDVDYPLAVRGGLEVQPIDELFLRAGFSTAPTRFSTGIGFALGSIRADVAVEHHEALGWSPAFELGARW